MTIVDLGFEAQVVSAADEIFERFGLRVVVGHDFKEYHRLLLDHRPHQPLGAPFDPDLHKMSRENAFWIIGYDSDDRIIHTQAMRALDLSGQSLAEYLRGNFRSYPPVGVDLDLDASRYRPGPGARRITGRCVYHGELWLDDSATEYRGSGLSSVLGRFAFQTCLERLAPDYVFGFVARPVAFKGLAERLGFMHAEPSALHWHMAESERVLEGFMVYMSCEDMRFVLGLPMQDLVA